MVMVVEKYTAGETVPMMCCGCDVETDHLVETVTKQGKLTKAICQTCETVSTFSRGAKTGVTVGNAKAPSEYDRTRKYKKGQAMMHKVYGHGEVTAVIEPQKIDVLFGDQTRRLIHAQV